MENNFIIKSKHNNHYRKFSINKETDYIQHFKSITGSVFKNRLINNIIYGIGLYKY
jgi:hypothetical protein